MITALKVFFYIGIFGTTYFLGKHMVSMWVGTPMPYLFGVVENPWAILVLRWMCLGATVTLYHLIMGLSKSVKTPDFLG